MIPTHKNLFGTKIAATSSYSTGSGRGVREAAAFMTRKYRKELILT